ncbi:MAG: VWA domain-containing protein [Candidatus Woesearchaeota archaeon]|nr:VWA domain-containing protein [Candidatus Woesearchaeota archaeon]
MEIIFQRPFMLFAFFAFPVLIVLHYYFFQRTKSRAMKFSNFSAMKRVSGVTLITKNTSQLVLRLFVMSFFIMAASGPMIMYEGKVGIESYVIAIDSSASMSAQDFEPSRLEFAKKIGLEIASEVDKAAVVSFAGVTFIRSALTDEKVQVRQAINSIDIEHAGGTDLGSAMITSVNLLPDGPNALVLITDGSDTSGIFVEDGLRKALDYVKRHGAVVHTVLIGKGTSNPGYLDADIPAAFDDAVLKEISKETGGKYIEISEIEEIIGVIDSQVQSGIKKRDMTSMLFLIALAMLMFEWLFLNTKFRTIP